MASPLAARRMLPTRPPVRMVSAAPFSRTLDIIRKASDTLAPPSTKTQGRSGCSIRPEMTQYSSSNSRPMAEGSTCSKPHREGWSRWAAAKASHT